MALMLGTLGNNGGSTMTMSLPATSPPLNVVPLLVCSTYLGGTLVDQRNFVRPVGANPNCAIGAFE